jgi:hypothetical protein
MSWIEDQLKGLGRAIDKYIIRPIFGVAFDIIEGVFEAFMPDMPEIGDAMAGRSSTAPNSIASGNIIYGKTRVSGTTIYQEVGGSEDSYLWSVACFACHKVERFEKIYYHDLKVVDTGTATGDPSNNFVFYPPFTDAGSGGGATNGYTQILHFKNGGSIISPVTAGQSNSFGNVDRYAEQNAVLSFRHFQDGEGTHFPHGQPNVTAEIKGAKVYDPRKDSTSSIYDNTLGVDDHRTYDADTWEWSDNPALCLLDYMTNTNYGLGESHDNFDYATLLESINTCNEDITINDNNDTQKAFTCNGVLSTGRDFKGNIAILLGSMNGRITFSGGKFFIDAYHYKTPHTDAIDEDDCLSSFQVTTKATRKSMYNTVRGKFTDKEANYILSEYPIQTSSTYISDDGEELIKEVNLAMTDDNVRAQRIAHFQLLRSRMQDSVRFDMGLAGLKYKAGDNVKITNTIMGYQDKVFEITKLAIKPDPKNGIRISIQAIENVEANYDPDSVTYKDYTTDGLVSIPDYNNIATPTNLTLERNFLYRESDASSTTTRAAISISFDHLNLQHISHFELRYSRITNLSEYGREIIPKTENIEHELRGLLTDTTYKIMVHAVSVNNVFSPMATINATTLSEPTTVVAPTNLRTTPAGGKNEKGYKNIKLSWDSVESSEVFFRDYEVEVIYGTTGGKQTFYTTEAEQIVQVPEFVNIKEYGTTTIKVYTRNEFFNKSTAITKSLGTSAIVHPQKLVAFEMPRINVSGTSATPTESELSALVNAKGARVENGLEVLYVQLDGSGNPINSTEYEFTTDDFIIVRSSEEYRDEVDSDSSLLPELITNGTFDTNSDWTFNSYGRFSITGGQLVCDSTTSGVSYVLQTAQTDVIGEHTLTFNVANTNASETDAFHVLVQEGGDTALLNEKFYTSGQKTFNFTSQNRNILVVFIRAGGDNPSTIEIDNVSLKTALQDAITEYTLFLPETVTEEVTFTHSESEKDNVPDTGVTETYTGFDTDLTSEGRKYVKVALSRNLAEDGFSQLKTTVTATWTDESASVGDAEKKAEAEILLTARVI